MIEFENGSVVEDVEVDSSKRIGGRMYAGLSQEEIDEIFQLAFAQGLKELVKPEKLMNMKEFESCLQKEMIK